MFTSIIFTLIFTIIIIVLGAINAIVLINYKLLGFKETAIRCAGIMSFMGIFIYITLRIWAII